MPDNTLTPETEKSITITLTYREWAFAAGVLGSAVELSMLAGANAGGMPEDIAHMTATASKLRTIILEEAADDGVDFVAESQ